MSAVIPPALPNDSLPPANIPEWEAISQAAFILAKRLYAKAKLSGRDGSPFAPEEMQIAGTDLCIRWALAPAADDNPRTHGAEPLSSGREAIALMQRKYKLTRAEARVAMLLARRKTNREIANDLDITGHTARRHTEHVMKKLTIHRRADVEQAFPTLESSIS